MEIGEAMVVEEAAMDIEMNNLRRCTDKCNALDSTRCQSKYWESLT